MAAAALMVFCGQDSTAQQSAGDCRAPEYGLLNFWIGDWAVFLADQRVGENRIEKVLGGCAVIEHWRDSEGREGKSLFYRDATGWKQVWVTDGGTSKEKRHIATLEDGSVRFQGSARLQSGEAVHDRTTLTPLANGGVRHVIEQSPDGGQKWVTQYDLTYLPRPPVARSLTHDGATWMLTDASAVSAPHLGRQSLRLRTGEAYRRDLLFEDGTIEFEMAPTPVRSFLGVMFRVREENGRLTYEDVYFRPTASGQWDAAQYAPVFQGFGTWQLYHGNGFNASVDLPADTWIPVRIEVAGDRAQVFVGGAAAPSMSISLRGPRGAGFVGFWGFLPGRHAEDKYSGSFTNLRVTPRKASGSKAPVEPEDPAALRAWALAHPVAAGTKVEPAPAPHWIREITAEASGLVNLTREFPHSVDDPKRMTWARTILHADAAKSVPLALGFSDTVRVFLNGQLLFSGKNEFRLGYPPALGLVAATDTVIHLPLRAGRNDLVVEIRETEDFGWGFVARLLERSSLNP